MWLFLAGRRGSNTRPTDIKEYYCPIRRQMSGRHGARAHYRQSPQISLLSPSRFSVDSDTASKTSSRPFLHALLTAFATFFATRFPWDKQGGRPSPPLKGNTLFSALSYLVPANLPGGIHSVTWSGTISTVTPGVKVNWQWAAAVYPNFSTNPNQLGVKPVDDKVQNPYLNQDHAGTPENFKTFVIPGATGGGGSNYTGGLSGTATVGPCQP